MPISPSGSTLASILSGGVESVLAGVLAANPSLSPGAKFQAINYATGLYGSIHSLEGQFFGGSPVDQADYVSRLDDLATGLAVLAQVATEVKQLVASNPGTLRTTEDGRNGTFSIRRRFP